MAQSAITSSATLPIMDLAGPMPLLASLAILALVPLFLMAVTSFVKVSVVFGILRNAIGAQQIPSTAITSILALVLTMHIMAPVFNQVWQKAEPLLASDASGKKKSIGEIATLKRVFAAGSEPLLEFLARHSGEEERLFFLNSAQAANNNQPANSQVVSDPAVNCQNNSSTICLASGEGLMTLIPAFVISELREAFAIGFSLFLPFLIIDLVVANLLVGTGLTMLTPMTIALPLKIILFVLTNAWFLLCKSLVLGYQ